MSRDNDLRFFHQPHNQAPVGRVDLGVQFLVDEGVAIAIQRLLNAGYRTLHSCQWDGPITKKFPAYINPGAGNEWERLAVLHREKVARAGAREVGSEREQRYAEAMQAIADSPLVIVKNLHDMAETIGLAKGEYRIYGRVLWFKPWVEAHP